jgi:hypothetical protein
MKKIFFFSFVLFVLFSCKKNKNGNCNLDMSGLSGTYKLTAVKYKRTQAAPEEDYYSAYDPEVCKGDDLLRLNSNGTYVSTDGAISCTPSGNKTGVWSLSGNIFSIDGEMSNVESFDCSHLTISRTGVTFGSKITLVYTQQ